MRTKWCNQQVPVAPGGGRSRDTHTVGPHEEEKKRTHVNLKIMIL
jgi:hypothetical protein